MNTGKQMATPQIGWLCSYVPEEIVLAAGSVSLSRLLRLVFSKRRF